MAFVWLIAWLCCGWPSLHTWNSWLIALIVCLSLDVIGSSSQHNTR